MGRLSCGGVDGLTEVQDGTLSPGKGKLQFGPADIGADSELVTRHDEQGVSHDDNSLDTHITVGHVTASLAALDSVYGGSLCHSSLCSLRAGKFRLRVCDRAGQKGHTTINGGAHKLPWKSGPNSSSWSEVKRYREEKKKIKKKDSKRLKVK
jgi:hypothetical protein